MGAATGLLPRTPWTPGRIHQVRVPPAGRALSTLARVDYEDAFRLGVGPAQDWTGEQWARALLEDAPVITRRALQLGWLALGLQLGSGRLGRPVLGWQVRRSSPDFALLGASSRLGMEAEVLIMREENSLLAATFLQQMHPIARAVWALVAPGHRQIVRYLLEQVSRREGRMRRPASRGWR